VLTANAPETKDNDFTWKDFQARNNNELVAVLGNFVNRVLVLTQKYFSGQVPAKGELSVYDRDTLAAVANIKAEVEKSLDSFRFREALKNAMDLARLGNKYLADEEPWIIFKTDSERVETILHVCLQITASLTIILEPFLPFSMEKLRGFLRMEQLDWAKLGETGLLPAGHQVNQPELLFEKIEDDVIDVQLQKLMNTKKTNEMASAKAKPSKANVTFDDFSKMDIRVGTIMEAEKVPKTQKLLKLKIDTGFDKRTVVSGIAEYYKPEDLIGKQVSVLVNLEPKNLKGIDSQGMILCAENTDGTLSIVSPDTKVRNGSEVK
jgi:methionyl-tRNA synthetase